MVVQCRVKTHPTLLRHKQGGEVMCLCGWWWLDNRKWVSSRLYLPTHIGTSLVNNYLQLG